MRAPFARPLFLYLKVSNMMFKKMFKRCLTIATFQPTVHFSWPEQRERHLLPMSSASEFDEGLALYDGRE
jgi:hypothetical protein